MKARVTVTLKSGILDPQGKAIEGALKSLGVTGVASVRQGKVFDIELGGGDAACRRHRPSGRARPDAGAIAGGAGLTGALPWNCPRIAGDGSRRRLQGGEIRFISP